jgi:hypothetical protein
MFVDMSRSNRWAIWVTGTAGAALLVVIGYASLLSGFPVITSPGPLPMFFLGAIASAWAPDMGLTSQSENALWSGVALAVLFVVSWLLLRRHPDLHRRLLTLLFASLASLTILEFVTGGMRLGVKYEGAAYTRAMLVMNVAGIAILLAVCLQLYRRKPWITPGLFHWLVFAWIGWCAVPWLGEVI